MAADYAGAIAAIKQRFIDNWLTGGVATTPVKYVNGDGIVTTDSQGNPIPWVLFEIVNAGSRVEGFGSAGNNTVVYYGLIKGHVFTRITSGPEDAYAKALAIGEIFRNKVFFDAVTPGCFVRSGYRLDGPPRVDEGDASSDDGNWFAVTATIPFEYWHLA